MKRSWSRIGRWLGRHAVALVPLLGLAELGAALLTARRAPRFEAWDALAAPVGELRQPGDLVVVAPRWAEPLVRRALAPELMPLSDLGRADATRHGTAVEVSILGQHEPELASWRELARSAHGPFALRRLANPGFRPARFDFVAALAPAHASVSVGEPPQPCPYRTDARVTAGGLGGHPTFPAARFACPGGEFFNASVTIIADQDFRPRRCIWAHPPRRGALQIEFRDVPLGDVIAGHGGLYWMVEREQSGAPIELQIDVDGDPVAEVSHRDGEGWAGFEVSLGPHAGAQAATVRFAVSSADHRHRHFCFEAISR